MSKFKEIVLAVAIVVVLNLFVNYGVYTFYKPPVFEKFCPVELSQAKYSDKAACDKVDGRWFENNNQTIYYKGEVPVPTAPADALTTGWCDPTAKCREGYDAAQSLYNRNVFIILVVAGIVSLALGFFVIHVGAVANGFLGGGLISLIVGTVRYWSNMDDYLRFVILGLTLALLIIFGYKKISNRN